MSPDSFDQRYKHYEPVDSANLSSKDLERGMWWVEHKVLFRNAGIALLLAFDIFLISYALWGFGSYIFLGNTRERQATETLAGRLQQPTADRAKSAAALPLSFGQTQVFDGGNGTTDVVLEVENPNKEWYVEVVYALEGASTSSTEPSFTYILPGERKFLTILGQPTGDVPLDSVAISVIQQSWKRVDQHQYPDVSGFIAARSDFRIDNALFIPPSQAPADEEFVGNRITFTITNNTAYNYWVVPVQIVLMRGGFVQGVEEVLVRELQTGESRDIDLRNYTKSIVVDEVVVHPSVDVFDESVYMSQ